MLSRERETGQVAFTNAGVYVIFCLMSLYSNWGDPSTEHFPGIEVMQLEPGLSVQEFEEFASTLVIPLHVGMLGTRVEVELAEPLDSTIAMHRSPDSPRESWAPDHHWHTDRAYWGENQFATILYAQELSGDVAGTELIDTTLLLEAIERDHPGMTEILKPGNTVFSVTKYFAKVLPVKGSQEAIQRTLDQNQSSSLEEVVEKQNAAYPAKRFPTIPQHPFRWSDCLMLDEARTVDIEGTILSKREVQALIATIVEDYLALAPEELADRPYYANHEWEEGQVLIMPQIGAIHRAQASPPGELVRNTLRLFIH